MKKAYEKPFITRQLGGITNKFGSMTRTAVMDTIDGVKVADLITEYGSPLFVYSERRIKEKYRHLIDAFSLRYPKVCHAWSYKTNYLKSICRTFHRLGSWAEVVSEMEYEMAIKLGIVPSQIIFNGPFKPYKCLKRALSDGATVNLDNMDELYEAEKISTEMDSPVTAGIRVNMSLGTSMAWDRFGFNIESGQAHHAVKRAVSGGKVKIEGVHAHVGTFLLDPDTYRLEVEKLIEFSMMLKDEFGIKVKYIDIGGGFPSHNKLKGTYLSTSDMVPIFERYAEVICDQMLAAFKPDELPLLILESGRALIDEAGMLISSVAAVKRLNNGMRALVIDAGVNLLFTSFWYDHEIFPTVDKGTPMEEHVIYGPLCMQIDVIRTQIRLPYLEKGDSIIIKSVGAYNNTQWMQFINLRPNIVMISDKGKVSLIREAETVDYLQERERFPEWLKD
jgi:diaminopimelate decarboxylase